jgi:hypothetical protein
MISSKWKNFIVNDISDAPKLFVDAVNGKYANEKRWISRDEFHRLKESDPYIRYVWSFSNQGSDYLYSKEIEPWKKAFHYAVCFNDFSLFEKMGIHIPNKEINGDRIALKRQIREEHLILYKKYVLSNIFSLPEDKIEEALKETDYKVKTESERLRGILCDALKQSGLTQSEIDRRTGVQMSGHWFGRSQWAFPTYEFYTMLQQWLPLPYEYFALTGYLNACVSLLQLQSLESLRSLQNLERLQSLERLQEDYRDVVIPKGATVYCDIPYKGTAEYVNGGFNHDEFYEWVLSKDFPIFISEYSMPDNDFTCIGLRQVQTLMNGKGKGGVKEEKLFVQTKFADNILYPLFKGVI